MLDRKTTEQETQAPAIGTPVYNHTYGKTGFIAEVTETGGNVFTIGAGGMQAETSQVVIVWQDGGFSAVALGIAQPWIDRPEAQQIDSILNAPEMLRLAKIEQANAHAERQEAAEKHRQRVEEFRASIRSKIPADARAVIVAELVHDRSDSMTDYFGSTTSQTVILGFSKHTRDLFPEMRKAARNFDGTAHLADAPDDAEHREKYSMGGGYYLKDGYRHSDGWKIHKIPFYGDDPAASVPFGDWKVPEPVAAPAATAAQVEGAAGFTVEEHTHTKKGFQMWVAVPAERVEREIFDAMRDAARALGGWYSRKWGACPAGFAFKSPEAAQEFVAAQGQGEAPAAAPAAPDTSKGDKLRDLADGMQSAIDDKRAPRLENTPKRQRQAAGARQDAAQMERAQAGLRALADMHDAGTVPAELVKVTTKKRAMDLARERIDHSGAGYYDAGRPTGEPATQTPEALAFWELPTPRSAAEVREEDARRKLAEIKRSSIPGFFGTPADVADDLTRYAGIKDGDSVLEPNAGAGAILDAIERRAPGAKVTAYEINGKLCDYLALTGREVTGRDFMEAQPEPRFDAVVMNPPFERGQDMEHVRRAFNFLKPGGRLVSIMAPGFQYRQDRRAIGFREWLEDLEHFTAELPAGTFKEAGTGVASVVVYIEKPEGE